MRVAITAVLLALLLTLPTAGESVVTGGPTIMTASDAVRMRAAGPLTVSVPSTVQVGARIAFRGRVQVKAHHPRRVTIRERVGTTWRVRAHVRSNRAGAFTGRLAAATKPGRRIFRAEAPAARGLRAVRTSAVRVVVTAVRSTGPSPSGHAEAEDWTYLFEGGARWNPCAPITWSYDPAGQEYGAALTDLRSAFSRIATASGLPLRYVGATGGDIVVSWADAATVRELAGDVVGIGGGAARVVSGKDVGAQMVSGYLKLDKDATFVAPGYGHPGWGQVMMHEILHALGLGHAQWFDTQLMWRSATERNVTFGLGDRTGMRRIGLAAGCL